MQNTTQEQLGDADKFATRAIAKHLVAAMRHAQQGQPINGMRQLLAAMDAVSVIESADVRVRAFELCRYAELAFEAHQYARWAESNLTVGGCHV